MTSSAPLHRLHNSPGCSWQSCESGELNDVMRWHLLVQELSAALQPPFFAEGPAQRLTSFSWSRTKKNKKKNRHHQNSSNIKIDTCLEEEGENRRQRISSAVWRCGKTRVGLKCFSQAADSRKHHPWTVNAGIPKPSSRNAFTHLSVTLQARLRGDARDWLLVL